MERSLLPLIILLLVCGCAQNISVDNRDIENSSTTQTSADTSTAPDTSTSIAPTTSEASTTSLVTTTTSTTSTTTTEYIPQVEKNKWVREDGIRLENAFSPAVIKLGSGVYRMLASASEGINAYVSPDGLKYVLEKKKVISPGYSPRVYQIRDNRYMMVYNNAETLSGSGDRKKMYYKSASCSDGLNYNMDASLHLSSQVLKSPNLVSSPEILRLDNGALRMYYTGDLFASELGGSNKKIRSALSLDKGNTWMREDGIRINAEALDPCAVILPDGKTRLYYSAYDSRDSDETMSIYSALSEDGLNYTIEGKAHSPEQEGTRYMDPRIVEIPGGYRMYYTEVTGQKENETMNIKSAVYITS